MTFAVLLGVAAQEDMAAFARYAADYREEFAHEQFTRLNRIFSVELTQSPNVWGYFYVTGAPFRAYLFRVGRRTAYWIVYTVDEDAKIVKVLRVWNASQDPEAFRI